MIRTKLRDRILPVYTKGEEIFNMTSHIVGAVLGIVAIVLCVVMAAVHKNPYGVVSSAIYGSTMLILYTMSSIYHGLSPKCKREKSDAGVRSLYNLFTYCRFIYPICIMHF